MRRGTWCDWWTTRSPRRGASRAVDAGDLAFDAYIAFEPLEGPARMRNPGLVADMERHFADFKGALKAGDLAAAEAVRTKIETGMPAILELSTPDSTRWGVFLESFVIIVREGFEAILVLGAVVAFLIKTGNRAPPPRHLVGRRRGELPRARSSPSLLSTILKHVPASQDTIEGVTMLIAVVVLFSVSYWLLSKVEAAKWQKFIRDKVNAALSRTAGSSRWRSSRFSRCSVKAPRRRCSIRRCSRAAAISSCRCRSACSPEARRSP